jgi:hypothetical protein
MNRTIISIEVQDNGGKEAIIIVTGERNNQIMFEEQFTYILTLRKISSQIPRIGR